MKRSNQDNANVFFAHRVSADSWYINEARELRTAYLYDLVNKRVDPIIRAFCQRMSKGRGQDQFFPKKTPVRAQLSSSGLKCLEVLETLQAIYSHEVKAIDQ